MPNHSVFTRLGSLQLQSIFNVTKTINHEVCAQQCDAHTECAVFEFRMPHRLCVLARAYARLSDDLAKGAFQSIIFAKVVGTFTKVTPKERETCLDKAEYEDYVKHEVEKWLKPSPVQTTTATASASSEENPAHVSTHSPAVTSHNMHSQEGGSSGAHTTTVVAPSSSEPEKIDVTVEGTTSTSVRTTTSASTTATAAVTSTPGSSSTAGPRSESSSVGSTATETEGGEETKEPGSTVLTSEKNVQEDSSAAATAETSQPSPTPTYVAEDRSSVEAADQTSTTKGGDREWLIKSTFYHNYLRVREGSLVQMGEPEMWTFREKEGKVRFMCDTGDPQSHCSLPSCRPRAASSEKSLVDLSEELTIEALWTVILNNDGTVSLESFNGRIGSAEQVGNFRTVKAALKGVEENFVFE